MLNTQETSITEVDDAQPEASPEKVVSNLDQVDGARGEALPAPQPEKVLPQIELIRNDSCTAG